MELADYNNNTLYLDTTMEKIGTFATLNSSGSNNNVVINLTCNDIKNYKYLSLFIENQNVSTDSYDTSPILILNTWKNDTSKKLTLLLSNFTKRSADIQLNYHSFIFEYVSPTSIKLVMNCLLRHKQTLSNGAIEHVMNDSETNTNIVVYGVR